MTYDIETMAAAICTNNNDHVKRNDLMPYMYMYACTRSR